MKLGGLPCSVQRHRDMFASGRGDRIARKALRWWKYSTCESPEDRPSFVTGVPLEGLYCLQQSEALGRTTHVIKYERKIAKSMLCLLLFEDQWK